MNTVVLHHDIETSDPWGGGGLIQQCPEVAQSPLVFTGTQAMEALARFEPQGACQRVLFMLAWRRDLLVVALRHPGGADFGQQVD